jgi:hypothetical protein
MLLSPAAEIEGRQVEAIVADLCPGNRGAALSEAVAGAAGRRLSHGAGHALLAAVAPLALIVAALAPAAGSSRPRSAPLLLLVLLDALFAGGLRAVRLLAPRDAEVGEPSRSRWRRSLPARRAAAGAGRAGRRSPAASRRAAGAAAGGERRRLARGCSRNRRGTGAIGRFWLRWSGPLGLAHRQVRGKRRAGPRAAEHRPGAQPALQIFLRDAQFGMVARRIRGEGTDFEALAEYEPGMDRRRIDWKAPPATPGCSPRNTRSSATTRSCSPSIAGRRCASRWPGCRASTAPLPPRLPPPMWR